MSRKYLKLHELNNGSYYLAILMLGAYQDTIGDYHNLFGAANEVHIIVDDSGEWHIKQIVNGIGIAMFLATSSTIPMPC